MNPDGTPKVYAIVSPAELRDRPLARAHKIVSLAPIMLGTGILLGGERRFNIPGFEITEELMPHQAWGGLFLVCGILMALYAWDFTKHVFFSAFFSSTLFAFWTITLVLGCLKNGSPWTGPAIYLWATICTAAVAARDVERVRSSLGRLKNRVARRRT